MLRKLLVFIFMIFIKCFEVGSPMFLRSPLSGRSFLGNRMNAAVLSSSQNDFKRDYETKYYQQILDHFTFTPRGTYDHTFQQRYLLVKKYWGGPRTYSPIFVYIGDEGDIEPIKDYTSSLMTQLATHSSALLVYIEHRYYGSSMPFGSEKESFRNATTLGYLTAEQAMADCATLIVDLKKNLSALDCPVVVLGGSYGGMLAAWFRLKYPHIAHGALAVSAPILYFEDITPQDAYSRIATKDFRSVSETCYTTIKNSWGEIDKVGSTPAGLAHLRKTFNTCQVFTNTTDLIDRLLYNYEEAAQYDYELVKAICEGIDGLPQGTDILTRISAGAAFYNNYNGNAKKCLDLKIDINQGFEWQRCTQMVMPFSYTPNTTMFPLDIFDMESYAEYCWRTYGVRPRANWITTEFGGHNIKRVLKRFGSNIIFSNGLRDPYSGAGVLESVSESIVALVAAEGVHCQDLRAPNSNDPQSVKEMRLKEIGIIRKWISKYKDDLRKNISNST
uniref:Serine carboxypeptidase S28 family protein n=1 Tax=Araucaria cunninghamii TaxID=56994 RepID=A0A0D6QWP3_ARACU